MIPTTDWVYDIETYLDLFCVDFTHVASRTRYIFEVSDRVNQSPQFITFLYEQARDGSRLFGFNNEGFDWPVCQHLIQDQRGWFEAIDAHSKANAIIGAGFGQDRWAHNIWPSDRIVTQGDLFKIHHFDNKARQTSLKKLEINMRSRSVVDLPYPPNQPTTGAQKDEIIAYMCHDVSETLRFYHASLGQIRFRDELARKYPDMGDVLNMNDTKIGKKFFEMQLEESGVPCREYRDGRRQPRQTIRTEIALRDVISPRVTFEHPEFLDTMRFITSKTITPAEVEVEGVSSAVQTKGFFSKFDTVLWPNGTTTRHDPPLTQDERREVERVGGKRFMSKTSKKGKHNGRLACVVDDFTYDFGTGGIHGSLHSTTVRECDEWEIWDWDVASYYPNLAISNQFYPAHLSEAFCDIYERVYQMRKEHKKGTAENAMLKLALNGVYGDSNNKYSPFYDPQYTMGITINGQLMLCMLAEWLTTGHDSIRMIQINTDGLTVKVRKGVVDWMKQVCARWESHTGLALESARYHAMHIRDVNSYLAEKHGGGVKRIGAYAYETPLNSDKFQTGERGWHQDHSMLVVRKAAEAQMVHGVPVRDFIMAHRDPFDFMLSVKVPRSSRLETGQGLTIQNNTRYYVSTDGVSLTKVMPPLKGKTEERRIGIQTGWTVTVVNDADKFRWDNVNWLYYVTEAEKLVI